ncbi:hypothetical protein HHK36_022698 [Tetracentron sinense]|uniref:PHD-type domain-containing protein n=1 Tax=Tetracentron sinense TaxID=13715 RepID=A0A835D720_TETSI|nr:hypothetical protein HHK36_022698 [Tetracentron sinense]
MREGLRSGNLSGRLEEDKVSPPSGSLIARKKRDKMSAVGSSGKQVPVSKKEKKPRLTPSDSGCDEDSLVSPRSVSTNQACKGSIVRKKNRVDSYKHKKENEIDRKRSRSERAICREDTKTDSSKFEEAVMGRKRSRFDVFECDEDVECNREKMKNEPLDEDGVDIGGSRNLCSNSMAPSRRRREVETGCSRSLVVDKRENFNLDSTPSLLVERMRATDHSDKKRSEIKKDGTFQPFTRLREKFKFPCDEPIRLEGKSDVSKVMLNDKKVGRPRITNGNLEAEKNRKGSRSADTVKRKTAIRPSFSSEKKVHEKPGSVVITQKNKLDSQKFSSTKNVKDHVKKEVKGKGDKSLPFESLVSTRHKEGGVKHGNGNERQLLRDQIREMLLSASWTIDYRPRRNKDYHDAVYTSPRGRGYWSITKAYDVFQKQNDNEDNNSKTNRTSSPFTPISMEALSKLTRQRHKKIERKVKKQKPNYGKEASTKKSVKNKHSIECMESTIHEGKPSSLVKKGGKSLKGRINKSGFVNINTKDRAKNQNSTHLSPRVDYVDERESWLHEQGDLTCTLQKGMPKPVRVPKPSFASDARFRQGRKNRKQSGCALLIRNSNKAVNSDNDDFIPYTGKRTLLSWLIDSGTVPLNGKVQYMNQRRTRVLLEGWITRDGIHCGCCSKILTVSKFEIHAGSKLCQPLQNIYVETGISLLQCQLDSWNRQEESERSGFHFVEIDCDDPNDDTCGICGDGGDLICCDDCPSTFHQSCLDIQMLPPGDWHCPNCSCKFCATASATTAQGDAITVCALLTCSLCEKKYHQLCIQEMDAIPVASNSLCTTFCGLQCRELFEQLQKLLWVKHELESGFSWTLIKRSDVDSDKSLQGLSQRVECNSKLSVALTVMNECFLPIVDRRSGVNLIHNVLYSFGSNFNRLNYSGFYTAVLEKGDEIISAASIRLHGTRLAEMPFIGTRHIYRHQGMCRRLLNAIESALCSLNVEKLIIPAIPELMNAWTLVFGFETLEESHKQERMSMNMLVFPGTDLLQKLLLKRGISEGNITASTVVKPIGLKSNHHNMTDVENESYMCSSAGPDLNASDEGVVHHKINEEAAAESGLQDAVDSVCDTSDVMSNPLDAAHGPKLQCGHGDNIEMENKSILDNHVECNIQSSAEGSVDDSNEANAEVSCVEPNLLSLGEISVRYTTKKKNEYQNSVSGSEFQAADESTVHFNSDLNHHNILEEESESIGGSHFVSDSTLCDGDGKGMEACEAKTESAAVESDLCTDDQGSVHHCTDIITQSQDAAFVHGFPCSVENIVCHDSDSTIKFCHDLEEKIQPHGNVFDCKFQGSGENLVLHDSQLLQMVPESLSKESVEFASDVVNESLYAPYKCRYPASSECKGSEFLFTSDSAHHRIDDVADDTSEGFCGDSNLRSYCQGTVLGTHELEAVVSSVDPCHHSLCGASVHHSHYATSELNVQASIGLGNSQLLHKLPELTSGIVHNVYPGANTCIVTYPVVVNHQASCESNVHDMHGLKDKVVANLHPLDAQQVIVGSKQVIQNHASAEHFVAGEDLDALPHISM